MHFPRTYALVLSTVGLLALAGCGSDDSGSTADTVPTPAGVLTPTDVASDEPADEASSELELPEIPSDLPTELPTDLDDLELGDCEDIYEAVLEATESMEDAMSDPSGAQDMFSEVSEALRDAADDSDEDIAAAAEELAAAYDEFGAAIAAGDMANVDVDGLTEASTALQEACLG